jgi:carbon monoxide dehydrogenase subunit G
LKLTNELQVAAPVAQTWRTLLDVPRVARALPGSTIDPDPGDGAYRGRMTVTLGPVSTEYAGTVRLAEVDEDERTVVFQVQAREVRGQGSAAATIACRLQSQAGGTRLIVQTDLQVTGRQAQFARGIMEDVAAAILTEFAARLEREILGVPSAEAEGGGEAFDLGAAIYRPLLERGGILAAGVALGVGLGLGLGRVIWRR